MAFAYFQKKKGGGICIISLEYDTMSKHKSTSQQNFIAFLSYV